MNVEIYTENNNNNKKYQIESSKKYKIATYISTCKVWQNIANIHICSMYVCMYVRMYALASEINGEMADFVGITVSLRLCVRTIT